MLGFRNNKVDKLYEKFGKVYWELESLKKQRFDFLTPDMHDGYYEEESSRINRMIEKTLTEYLRIEKELRQLVVNGTEYKKR